MAEKQSQLILFRHGDSRWNSANRFTGWVDIPLSELGIYECLISSKRLEGLQLDVAFCSQLIRTQQSLFIVLSKQDYTGVFMHPKTKASARFHHKHFKQDEIPIFASDKLNERYYGDLQGMDKDKAREKFGEEQVFSWRRGWEAVPPNGESLKDTYERVVPYFKNEILPHVKQKKNVIVSAHGNSLRAIVKYIEDISDENIPNLNFPTGQIVIYTYKGGKLTRRDKDFSFDRPIAWEKTKARGVKKVDI